jgi:SAM-dependent methyltransferase
MRLHLACTVTEVSHTDKARCQPPATARILCIRWAQRRRERHHQRVGVSLSRGRRGAIQPFCHRHDRSLAPGALDFSAGGHLYATHPLHAFAARLPPPLARWALETFTDPGDYVLDAMCGSGTTLVEGLLTGRHTYGVDIDPLARLIALTKATPVSSASVAALADEVERRLDRGEGDASWRPQLPRLDYWFREDVSADLARIKSLIVVATPPDSALRALAWTVFSSLIIARTSVANARDLVHSRHHYRQWTENPNTSERFLRALRRAARLMQDLANQLPKDARSVVRIAGNDARALSLADGAVDLSFFSPPYVSALDYPRAHAFAVAWLCDVLGVSPEQYRVDARRYIGTDRAALAEATLDAPLPGATGWAVVDEVVERLAASPAKAWTVQRYFRDMATVLAECARVTRPGGHVVIVVCPSNIRKVRVETHLVFEELAPLVSQGCLEIEDTYSRSIHDHRRVMPYLEHAFGERMRTEYVIVARRTPPARGGRLVDHSQLRRRRVHGNQERPGH